MRKKLGFGVLGTPILPIVCDEHPVGPGPPGVFFQLL